ncbi:MAG: LicD family protein [Roseburia sp.]|nr:LicD family protein [Roseburia sp.]
MEFLDSYFEDEVREGFYVPSLMKRAWAAQMELLEVVQNICDKHQIPLYAEWGTLLGAVRHKGRIPWDDDIDMCMLREDYEKFSKVIDAELPEDCWFIDFHRTKDVNLMLGRVMNSKFHVVEGELLGKYHGFPYVAGIDIFWLDSLPEDDRICRKYQEQINLIYRVLLALQYEECASKKMTRDEMEYHICQVEKMCGVSIQRNVSLREQLAGLLEKRTWEMGRQKSSGEITNVYLWRKNAYYHLPKEVYQTETYIPFENTKIRVPDRYEEILAKKYGENWKTPIRVGGLHDYPSYAKQQEFLKDNKAGELFAYHFSAEEMKKVQAEREKKVTLQEEVNAFFPLFREIHEEIGKMIRKAEWNTVLSLLGECQNTAIQIGTRVEERKGGECNCVKKWENYCEVVFGIHQEICEENRNDTEALADRVQEQLNAVILDIEVHLDELKEKKEIVFIPYKASLWHGSMQKTWKEAVRQEDTEVYVIPAPYYYKDAYGRAKTEKACYETENYPENVMITNFEEYDFQLRHPDRIVIQCPYDEYNYGITIHPFFYAKNLVKYTEDLVYIPGLLMDEAGDEGDRQRYNLKSYCNMPGVVYADHVIVQSGQMQKAYVELLTEFAGEDTRSIWEKKISFFPDKL